jgi:eukaryotic-like serine/threonine-protein kinase
VIIFGQGNTGLFRVAAAGGTPVVITQLNPVGLERRHRTPWFLPDDRHFFYTVVGADLSSKTYVADLESGAPVKDQRELPFAGSNAVYAPPGFVLFVRDGSLLAQHFDTNSLQPTGDAVPIAEKVDYPTAGLGHFSASKTGVLAYGSGRLTGALQLSSFDRSGKRLANLGRPILGDLQRIAISPDGDRVAVDQLVNLTRDIWVDDVKRGSASRITFTGTNQFPVWSPDGTSIAFLGSRQGGTKLMLKSADGSGAEKIIDDAPATPTSWSKDGRYLLTHRTPSKLRRSIWVVPAAGKSADKPKPFLESEFNEWNAKFSPDGRWVAYESDESKRGEIYVVGFPAGASAGKWQVSTDGGSEPVWSPDGRELYFLAADSKLMVTEVRPGNRFDPGVPAPLFEYREVGNAYNSRFDVTKDGHFVLRTAVEQSSTVPITVVLNWQAGLKK